jgi:hypothetical protein
MTGPFLTDDQAFFSSGVRAGAAAKHEVHGAEDA